MNLSLATRSGRWGLQNPQARIDQLLADITAADDLIASGRPEAARGLLGPFRGSGGRSIAGLAEDWPCTTLNFQSNSKGTICLRIPLSYESEF